MQYTELMFWLENFVAVHFVSALGRLQVVMVDVSVNYWLRYVSESEICCIKNNFGSFALFFVHFQELHAHINGSISEETANKLVSLKQSKDKSWHPSGQLQLGRHRTLAE